MDDELHKKQDRQSYLIHEIAFNDQETIQLILKKSMEVGLRWIEMKTNEGKTPCPYWASWVEKISTLPFEKLKEFALSQTDESIAHRQSSPISVCLSDQQKMTVRQKIRDEFRRA